MNFSWKGKNLKVLTTSGMVFLQGIFQYWWQHWLLWTQRRHRASQTGVFLGVLPSFRAQNLNCKGHGRTFLVQGLLYGTFSDWSTLWVTWNVRRPYGFPAKWKKQWNILCGYNCISKCWLLSALPGLIPYCVHWAQVLLHFQPPFCEEPVSLLWQENIQLKFCIQFTPEIAHMR